MMKISVFGPVYDLAGFVAPCENGGYFGISHRAQQGQREADSLKRRRFSSCQGWGEGPVADAEFAALTPALSRRARGPDPHSLAPPGELVRFGTVKIGGFHPPCKT